MSKNPSHPDFETMSHFDFLNKFKRLRLFEPSLGVLGFFLLTLCFICCFFYLDYRAVPKGLRISTQSDRFVWLRFNGSRSGEDPKIEFLSEMGSGCDVFEGDWVWDESYPLYQSRDCRFLDDGFRCSENGRPDLFYAKWRWQPKACDLPRLVYQILKARDLPTKFLAKRLSRCLVSWRIKANQFGMQFSFFLSDKVDMQGPDGSPIGSDFLLKLSVVGTPGVFYNFSLWTVCV